MKAAVLSAAFFLDWLIEKTFSIRWSHFSSTQTQLHARSGAREAGFMQIAENLSGSGSRFHTLSLSGIALRQSKIGLTVSVASQIDRETKTLSMRHFNALN